MENISGLSTNNARKLYEKYGPNVLAVKNNNPWWKMLCSQFEDVMVIILIIAAILSMVVGDSKDAIVILVIVFLNAGIGFFQEFKTEKTLEALKKMVVSEIRIIRDGKEVLLPTEQIVPGDVIVLKEGDKIPADGELIEVHSFQVEEAALTGESLPVEKKVEDSVFMGTSVARGSAIYRVTKTGMSTEFGTIAMLTTQTDKTKSPLQKELVNIGVFVTKITVIICSLLFIVGILRDWTIFESLIFAVSVAVAAVPQGLPTTITIALALGTAVLARKKAMIKKLSSVETLGGVTTICSDKTGTLTKNEMTVRELYLADRSIYNVTGVGYNPYGGSINFVGGPPQSEENTRLRKLLIEIGMRCNEAKLVKKGNSFKVLGDPTEGSLLTLAKKSSLDFDRNFDEIFPFDSDRKMMSIVHGDKVMVKGSPDQLLEKCTHWSDGHKTMALTAVKRAKIQHHYQRMASNALRVLAFAYRDVQKGEKITTAKQAEQKLVFVGLVGMIDPPRDEVRRAVEKCHSAGIRVVVITGDYGITAEAIARELHIVEGPDVLVLNGKEVEEMTDKHLASLLKDRSRPVIFSRSLPAQKMRVVSLLQKQGEVVAMTGDGVNDAPALKKADIGIAMGITGTDVSKEAATMILTNDSFASIVTAVEEGRRIYDNLKKFIWYIFSSNIGELTVIFLSVIFQFPLPITAILILCIDLGTDLLPGIALGADPADPGVMKRKPRDVKERIMKGRFIRNLFIIGICMGIMAAVSFLWTLWSYGWEWGTVPDDNAYSHAATVAFTTIVFVQLINSFSAKSQTKSIFKMNLLENQFQLVAIFTSVLMVLLMVYVPFLNNALETKFLNLYDWGIIAVGAFVPLFVVEIVKYFERKESLEQPS